MPNGFEFPALPEFPTLFGEREQQRLKELEERRREVEEIYQTKFIPEQWERAPLPERAVRRFLPSWLSPVARVLTPWEEGAWDIGFTPEQAQEYRFNIEEEYKELVRKQRVTRVLPLVKDTLRALALTREGVVTDAGELRSVFKLGEMGFSEEEAGYVTEFAQRLLRATPEEIVGGEVLQMKPLSPEDVEELARAAVEPRFITTTVSLSKKQEDITAALQAMYAPQVEDPAGKEKAIADYIESLKAAGITKETSEKLFKKIAEEEGEILVLTDEQTGSMVSVNKRPDNTVWMGEELIGYYDEKGGRVVPIDLLGQPLETQQKQEFFLKDWWDSFYLGSKRAGVALGAGKDALIQGFSQIGGVEIPSGGIPTPTEAQWRSPEELEKILPPQIADIHRAYLRALPEDEAIAKTKERIEHFNKGYVETNERLMVNYEERAIALQEWIQEHPEVLPKPEYEQSVFEHPGMLLDPGYIMHVILSSAPIIGTALGVGVGVTVVTGNPLAGAAAGAAVITPVEIGSLYDDLIANGALPTNASELANSVGTVIGAVEILPGMIVLKAANPILMRTFRKNFQKELTSRLTKRLMAKKILATATKIEIAETLEEVVQEAMHNAAVKTVNENRSIFENLPDTIINTLIAVAPLAMFGGGAEYVNMRTQLPPKIQEEIDTTASEMEDAGLAPDHAEAVAYNKVLGTEQGQAIVLKAADEALVKPAAPDKVDAKVEQLGNTLEAINTDIEAFSTSIPIQEERLAKMKVAKELPSEQMAQVSKIEDMKTQLAELESRKKWITKEMKKLKKAAIVPVTPEVIAFRGGETRITTGVRASEGSGLYVTSSKDFASTFPGKLTEIRYTQPKNPLVVTNERLPILQGWEGLWDSIAETDTDWIRINKQAIKNLAIGKPPVGDNIRFYLEKFPTLGDEISRLARERGFDAIQIRNPNLLGEVDPLVSKGWTVLLDESLWRAPPAVEPVAEPEVIPEQLVVPDPNAGRELLPDRRPRLKDWEEDQGATEAAVKADLGILRHIIPSKQVRGVLAEAERSFEDLHTRLTEAKANEEETKIITDEFGELAKASGLTKKKLLANHWDDLTPPDRASLSLASIPDGSITFPAKREVFDMRYYLQYLEEETGLPFYAVFKRIELSHGAARNAGEDMLKRIGYDPNFTHIRTDPEALSRVAREVNARNVTLNVEHPEGLTDRENLLADAIGEVYEAYKPIVRYLRFMRTAPNMDSLKDMFPDAVEAGKEIELALGLELRNKGDLDGLFDFLSSCDWGVFQTGYDPWMVSHPTLTPPRVTLGTTRGAARFMRRESVDYSEALERNVLQRLALYIKQVEAQWRLEPELDVLEGMWKEAGGKIANAGQVESALREWTRELQGIPTRQSFFDSVVRRVWRQAMSAVFLHPWMAFRNFHQHIAFHPDRSELFRLIADKGTPAMQEKSRIYFDSFASQLKGIRREWLYMGERGLPGLGWLTRWADRLSLYSHSDNTPRRWSFQASSNKAMRATEVYEASNKTAADVARWIRTSGANHLRQTERNHALELLAQPTFDLAVPGLREVSGGEMASMYIGHEVANMTHFIYERAFRAPVELGATGRTLFNLIVFPRGYFQRVFFQAQKVFSSEATWEEHRAGFKDIMLITVVGIMVSEWLRKVTGRPRRAYNPADIMQWQLGGLVIGVGMDVTKLISDIVVALDPTADPEFKEQVMARLPGEVVRQADVLVPFYRIVIDSIEASTDTKNIDVQMLRWFRALLNKDYTPEEIEAMDRSLWEKIRKAVLAGEPPDPTQFQEIQTSLLEDEARLGEMDATGSFYTLRQFAGDIKTRTKPVPDDMLTQDYNFSDLVIFHEECEDNWKELYKLPSSPASVRKSWREANVEAEAMLLFWGMYAGSVFREGSAEWLEVSKLLRVWFDLYGIDKRKHGRWADWTLPVE